jgi:serine-type D-Ala-D-Ala carboxypeptidase/endopeptidase (penicillin-binding protein 4)
VAPVRRSPSSLILLLAVTLVSTATARATAKGVADVPPERRARPAWAQKIEELIGDRPMSVAVGDEGRFWFRHAAWVRRPPASNEKLLLSMALLDRFGPARTIPTRALSRRRPSPRGVVRGDVWLVGAGDPEIDAARLGELARRIRASGVRRIKGSVIGVRGPFARDWWAPGWRDYFPTYYIALPTALTYRRNQDQTGRHVTDPERRAAVALTAKLRALGIGVRHRPLAGSRPGDVFGLAEVRSDPLRSIVHRMNVGSLNFYAEVLGKYLGARATGTGSIAAGAKTIRRFVASRDVSVDTNDSSGLSYANRATAKGIVRLLWGSQDETWSKTFRETLAKGGQGTLKDRLRDVRLRAKTGTLEDVSALSGWVWLRQDSSWAEFSIMSSRMSTSTAKTIENKIVRVLNANASDPMRP